MVHVGEAKREKEPASAELRWEDGAKQYSLSLQEGDTVQLGREATNAIVLSSSQVSRNHAVINWRKGVFELSDLGSTNGTRLNGIRVDRPTALKDGDVIGLCHLELSFHQLEEHRVQETDIGATTLVVPLDTAQPRLIITAGRQEGSEISLHGGNRVIGRATANASWDVALQDKAVSRPHAKIEQTKEGYIITDQHSANGTLVNGEIIAEPTPLQDGDVLVLGETTLLFRER